MLLKTAFILAHFCVLCFGAAVNTTDQQLLTTPSPTLNDLGYTYEARTGSWYKFYTNGATWTTANSTCVAEGTHLAIINSRLEANILKDLHQKYLGRIRNADWTYWVAIGIYREPDPITDHWNMWDSLTAKGTWKTVEGQTLEQAGYSSWYSGHPWTYPEAGYGFMFYGFLTSFDNGRKAAFICEGTPATSSTPSTLTVLKN